MDAFEVRPGKAIGPFRIGMTRDGAADVANALGLTVEAGSGPGRERRWRVGHQLFLYFDAADAVVEIEAALTNGIPVVWRGMRLDLPARMVVAELDAIAAADDTDWEFPATTCYPRIGLCLWMDAKPGEPLTGSFESVLVRLPVE